MSTPRPAGGPGGPLQPGGATAFQRPGGGPPGHALMMPAEKPKDFKGAIRRLVGMLKPEHSRISVVLVLGIVSVTFAVLGPKILGNATNVLFSGVVSKQLPAGVTQAQAVAALRAKGENTLAEMLSAMHLNPGHGVDFGALERILLIAGRHLPGERRLLLDAAVHHGRRGAAHRVPPAAARGREARPAAAQVLRRARARRRPQPHDQRHRQHLVSRCSRASRS